MTVKPKSKYVVLSTGRIETVFDTRDAAERYYWGTSGAYGIVMDVGKGRVRVR
jgi:hypothetical protein